MNVLYRECSVPYIQSVQAVPSLNVFTNNLEISWASSIHHFMQVYQQAQHRTRSHKYNYVWQKIA